MSNKILPIALVLGLSSQFIMADVAPPEGYVKVSRAIVIQTDDDLSEYRFFLISGDLVREVTLVKGEKVTLSGLGGGARYSGGTLYSVPAKAVSEFSAKLSREQRENLSEALTQDKLPGSVELLREGFSSEVRKEVAASVTDAGYRISKTANGVIAERLPAAAPNTGPKNSTPGSVSSETPFVPIAGGLFIAAIAIGGGLLFARSRQRRTS